jgi:hypothetical protein
MLGTRAAHCCIAAFLIGTGAQQQSSGQEARVSVVRAKSSKASDTEDEAPPKIRRKPRVESEFHESYVEGPLFKPTVKSAAGTLRGIDCLEKSARLRIVKDGKAMAFLVDDPKLVTLKGVGATTFEFECGVQKPRSVVIEYFDQRDPKRETAGRVSSIEFPRR